MHQALSRTPRTADPAPGVYRAEQAAHRRTIRLDVPSLELGTDGRDYYLYTPAGDPVLKISSKIGGHPIENAHSIAERVARAYNEAQAGGADDE